LRRRGTVERYELIDTLNYLSTEVHKRIFANVFSQTAAEPTRRPPRRCLSQRSATLPRAPGDRQTLVGDRFTVADAYCDVAELVLIR
jgi:glutathione S-transferase